MSWTSSLWAEIEGIYAEILRHPFLRGLTSGELPADAFAYYVMQDAHYLREYARGLAIVGAKAPTHAETAIFGRHAAETAAVELALHGSLMTQLGLDPASLDRVPVSPTTTAYTSYVIAVASNGSFAEGLAAVLPCYWIYQRVGEQLVGQGSPDARYQAWIDTYAGEAFKASVEEVLELADRLGPTLSAHDAERARRHFVTTSRYEWMFWDAAWRQEQWPV